MLCWKGVEFSLLLIFSAGDKVIGQPQSRSPGEAPRWVWGLGMELEVFSTLMCLIAFSSSGRKNNISRTWAPKTFSQGL